VKHLNISRKSSSARQMSADAWDRKVRTARETIAAAEQRLTEDWCIDIYADTARKEIAQAQAKLAKLDAANPYEA